MESQSAKAINNAFSKSRTVLFMNNLIRLTPDEVTSFEHNGVFPAAWSPTFVKPRFETVYHSVKPGKGLHEISWSIPDKYTSDVTNWTSGIYQSNIKFPEKCVVCQSNVEHFHIAELVEAKDAYFGKYTINVDSQKEADLINFAFKTDRFWFAVPFCKDHNFNSKGIIIRKRAKKFVFGFTNKTYGEQFAAMNNLNGFWRSGSNLFLYKFLFPFLAITSLIGIFFGVLMLVRGYKGSFGEAMATDLDIPIGYSSIIVFLIVLIIALVKIIRSERKLKKLIIK